MNSTSTAVNFWNEPIVVALVSVVSAAMITLIGGVLRMLNKLSKLESQLSYLAQQISEMKTDPDVMRWSNYGRAAQAFNVESSHGGARK